VGAKGQDYLCPRPDQEETARWCWRPTGPRSPCAAGGA
jgi:hypothetical protein